jgi:hypothetical protein
LSRRYPVRATRNFERNLEGIARFLGTEGGSTFQALLEGLGEQLLPLLEAQPGVGRPFLTRAFSPRAASRLEALRDRLEGRELREYLVGGFLVLYLVAPRTVYLLAVRDQRQVEYAL